MPSSATGVVYLRRSCAGARLGDLSAGGKVRRADGKPVADPWTGIIRTLAHLGREGSPRRWPRAGELLLALLVAGCAGGAPRVETLGVDPWVARAPVLFPAATARDTASPPATLDPRPLPPTPTPDPPRPTPVVRTESITYVVEPGDSLGSISTRFEVSPQHILEANGLRNPNVLSVGQFLTIPAPVLEPSGPSLKIIPDSELVYGPASTGFDLVSFSRDWGGYLDGYVQEVEGRDLRGPEMVQLVAQRYSVNPRLLLALLEYQGGWVTSTQVSAISKIYPMGFSSAGWEGLWAQLSWAADALNEGYYRWKAGWNGPYLLADRTAIIPGSGLNAGTVAVQHGFAQIYGAADWAEAVASSGFPIQYASMFGSPFVHSVEPLVPPDLGQPEFRLPIEDGATWSFTSGPHSAWGSGSAWAALDFAPPGNALGCVPSSEWIVAAADGLIVRSDYGEVVQDLDGDGFEQTGWVILYMHVGSTDRVPFGAWVHAGDRLGHPSCEGGISSGTHLHMARRYNGEWIPADGTLPFEMDGWVSGGLGNQYDGTMSRGDVILEACGCRNEENQISRER